LFSKTVNVFLDVFFPNMIDAGCNILVCLAVWQATSASSLASKAVGVWWPIAAFVAIGFEHSVANMFLVPAGIFSGADSVDFGTFLGKNLSVVTLGNLIGGVLVGVFLHATASSSSTSSSNSDASSQQSSHPISLAADHPFVE
jgi:formate/nitrite transporter FocA (FNT family)